MRTSAGRHRLDGRAGGRRMLAASAVGLATMTAAVGLTATSASAALGTYTVSVSPSSAIATTTNIFTVKFTVQSVPSSADLMHGASVTMPSGFTGVSAPAHVTGSDGTWNVSVSGSRVSLTSTSVLGMLPGQSVSVPVTATAPSALSSGLPVATTGTGTLGDAFSTSSTPTISVTAPPPGVYNASVAPSAATASTTNTFTVVFTAVSDPTSTDLLKSASVTFPAGFSGVTAPASVTGTDGSWSVTTSSSTVTLTSASAGLPVGGTVAVPVTAAAPSAIGSYPLGTSASSTLNDPFTYDSTASSPTVTVGTATCSSTQQCDTGNVGSASNTQVDVVSTPTTNSNPDVVDLTVGGNGLPCAPNNPAYNGQPFTYTTTDTTRTVGVTFRLDKTLVQQNPNNGTAHYSMCYVGKHPFQTKSGATSQQDSTTGLYYGDLATCAATANAVPCITSQSKDKAGDLVIVFNGDTGEPGGTVH